MMRSMRALAPWIMLIVALAFVGWMVFDVGMDVVGRGPGGTSAIARVNGEQIGYQQFYEAVRRVQELQRQQGVPSPTTLEESRSLEDQVLEELIQQRLLEDEYARRGIAVTDAEIRDAILNFPLPEIQQIPEFQTDGQFDITKYQNYLRSGADPSFALSLEARYREEIPRLVFRERVTADVYVSDVELWRVYRDRNETVTARVAALVPSVLIPDPEVQLGENEIAEYYRAHRAEFERPAQAHLSFVAVPRTPNAADTAAALERGRQLRQEILAGTSFADVARRESADSASRGEGGDLGEQAFGSFVPEFEQAVRSLRPGQVSEPVLTDFGYHLIRVESKGADQFHARHILVPIELEGDHLRGVDARVDTLDLVAAERESPDALDAAAERLNVPVAAAPPLVEGDRLQLGRYLVPDVGLWAFEALPGETSPVIETGWAAYVFRLDSLQAAGVPPLERVRDEVVRAARRARKWELTRTRARALAAALGEGASLEGAAERHGVTVRTIGPFSRVNPSPVLRDAPAAIGAAFGLPLDRAGGPYETDLALFFVSPISRTPADSAAFEAEKEELRANMIQQAQQAKLNLVLASLRESADVQDLREELRRQAREQEQAAPIPGGSPLGF